MGKRTTVTRQVSRVNRRSGNRACTCVLLFLLALLPALSPANARAQPSGAADSATVPKHVHVAACLEKTVRDTLQRSATFRAQMTTLSRTPGLGVAIVLGPSRAGRPADATIRRYSSGAILAVIRIGSMHDQGELLAHEVEHLIEQIEGVPLALLARTRSEVWLEGGSYESARAIAAGHRVRRELLAARPTTEP